MNDEPDTHVIEVVPREFNSIVSGKRHVEAREHNKDFKMRDILEIHEYNPLRVDPLTGRSLTAEITYIAKGYDVGLPDGYVVMSFDNVSQVSVESDPPSISPAESTEGFFSDTIKKTLEVTAAGLRIVRDNARKDGRKLEAYAAGYLVDAALYTDANTLSTEGFSVFSRGVDLLSNPEIRDEDVSKLRSDLILSGWALTMKRD
tara:strand:- start:3445 stop:4053 length:609 start_codon:yes stop_codon:yes gene_type:complete